MNDHARIDKLGLLAIAFVCMLSVTWLGVKSLGSEKLDPNASTLLGAIVAGLIGTAAACIQALRGFSMSAQLGKAMDQIAASGPVIDPVAKDAPSAAQSVADAAQGSADKIQHAATSQAGEVS